MTSTRAQIRSKRGSVGVLARSAALRFLDYNLAAQSSAAETRIEKLRCEV